MMNALNLSTYFMQLKIDPFSTFMGNGIINGGCSFDCKDIFSILKGETLGFCEYLLGPVLDDVGFKCMNRNHVYAMDKRDKTFYEHVKRNRSSVKLNSIRITVLGYYDEMIYSVAGYRS
ncbi:hypothetical protein BDA99DRAFT_581952 [Phascolomyces articulosus]|uniref:Presequence translocated-associated motor subunit PAM17 n=1 Tax=Phascolomyces articulosus TaxID=60185 RepID=A0AAD5K8W7_9FUNG|nr:hypothetical protein BDA99DRAFT_581952 [Phascolomyces articulosus]